ncbi:MAG: hypothetical protein H7138_09085 [Myxococcales bacterium]|nr:hypothetical protein [Myxococcales bacterium]
MRYLLLALVIGCVSPDSNGLEENLEGEVEAQLAAAIPACPTGTWCVEPAPVGSGTLLHGIWAVNANDVFAVGDGGTILRRTNNAWTVMASGTTRNLRGVWAASSTDVWASGVAGTILHYNGTAWSVVPTPSTSDVDSVWGSGPSDVWFAGGGTVLRWNGSSFTTQSFAGTMLSISGTGPRDVWACGENTNLRHFTGTSWVTVNPGAGTSTFFSVLPLSANDVWASDFFPSKETMHWTGSRWVAQRTSGAIFNSMSALSASDIWGAGGNDVGHWNGTAWLSDSPFGSNAAMWSVTTTPGHVWLVGSNALIGHRAL